MNEKKVEKKYVFNKHIKKYIYKRDLNFKRLEN